MMNKITLCLFTCLTIAPLASARQAEPVRPWTLMIYGAADNNADGPILHFLDSIRTALDDDPGMELILFIDRHKEYSDDESSLGADFSGARIYRLRKDTAELLDANEFFAGMSSEDLEIDSADPRNIGAFVAFCKQRFPARNYGLMIYSHANGCTMCPDEESDSSMYIPQLTDEVDEDASVDFLALELCNMAGIEISYQWRPGNGGFSADVLVAIPNAGPPLDWDRAFARIRSAGHAGQDGSKADRSDLFDPAQLTPAAFGQLVIEEGYLGRLAMAKRLGSHADEIAHEAAACYDLTKVKAVKRSIDAFAVALAAAGNSKAVLEYLRGPTEDATVMNYSGNRFGKRPYPDLYDLCLKASMSVDLSDEVRAAAKSVCGTVDEFVLASFGMQGFDGFEPGKNGVFIVFPDGDAPSGQVAGGRVWGELDWYTPLAAESDDEPYGRWAFLADGATAGNGKVENWFELLDSWFDDTSHGPSGCNSYAW
jgi:clostripain